MTFGKRLFLFAFNGHFQKSSVQLRFISIARPTLFKKGRGTGDQGKSSLYSNERFWKDDPVFEALGATDELNSLIGLCRETAKSDGLFDVSQLLHRVQCHLQDLASHMATPSASSSRKKLERTRFDQKLVIELDKLIDFYGDRSPPLKVFILPVIRTE